MIHAVDQPVIEVNLEVGREYLIARRGFCLADLPVTDFAAHGSPIGVPAR